MLATGFRTNGHKHVEGTIEAMNAAGVRIDGRWFNYSKFAGVAGLQPHDVGDFVGLSVAQDKWIDALVVGERPCVPDAKPHTCRAPADEAARQSLITKLAVLKAAAVVSTKGKEPWRDVADDMIAWLGVACLFLGPWLLHL